MTGADCPNYLGESSLRHALSEYLEHYNQERAHQGIGNEVIDARPCGRGYVRCRERLGGLLKFNRSAITLKPRRRYLEWTRLDDAEGLAQSVFETLHEEPHVYLLPEYEDASSQQRVLEEFWPELFEAMLAGWLTDPAGWPMKRTFEMFQEWFEPSSIIATLERSPVWAPAPLSPWPPAPLHTAPRPRAWQTRRLLAPACGRSGPPARQSVSGGRSRADAW